MQVKLVLAAAMWSNPHMLIMDEPTNYLDRESLGALALAIKEWSGEKWCAQPSPLSWGCCSVIHDPCVTLDTSFSPGGVVVISHHAEFTGALCHETWTVADGRLTITKVEPKDGTANLKLEEE